LHDEKLSRAIVEVNCHDFFVQRIRHEHIQHRTRARVADDAFPRRRVRPILWLSQS
jgi:hypothetical protein